MMDILVFSLMALGTVSGAAVKILGRSTCAMHNHEIRCWGRNDYGELGLGHTTDLYEPQEEGIDFGEAFTPKQLECGGNHCCVQSLEDTLKCWGSNVHGQLGYGDTNHRGDELGEMGDNLAVVDLPSGFVPLEATLGSQFTCILSTVGSVTCFGYNSYGDLGLGHTNPIGRSSDETGDNLNYVDLGSDFGAVKQLGGLNDGVCAVSTAGTVKCWGYNYFGELGLGVRDYRGDHEVEMGDYLPFTELGAGFVVAEIGCGASHCCVLSTGGDMKCWGRNDKGQLGYGDSNHRGDQSGEMGDELGVISSFGMEVREFECGSHTTCVILTDGTLKCWGYGLYGALGLGDADDRGDENDEMGDYLPAVDVGTGFTSSGIHIGGGRPYQFNCVFEESSADLPMKCFGRNDYGQLGYGDKNNRGDGAGEMGDFLPFIPFEEWPQAMTTPPPTEPICAAADMTNVNWHDMFHKDDAEISLLRRHSEEFDATTHSLSLSVTVEYVGMSSDGNLNDDINLGTTYWIDLQSFTESAGSVSDAGSCANRRAADYGGAFEEWWSYPTNPQSLDSTLTADRMAYPPSDWTISSTDCHTVTYQRTFTLAELTECTDSGGSALVSATETSDAISYEGTFHVELLSPFDMADSAYYRTFSLLQYEFAIRFARSADALASTGTLLFKMAATGISYDDAGEYEMRILTQSADFISLAQGVVVSNPMAMTGSAIGIEEETSGCLVSSSSVCAQIFVVTIPSDIDCAASASGDDVVDLSGLFRIGFSPQCNDQNAMCSAFVDGLGDSGAVLLDLDWIFVDRTCGVNLFDAAFDVDLAFFKDDGFSVAVDGGAFIVDQDTIYGQVEVTWPSDDEMYDLLAVSIANVFVCTAADDVDLSSSLDANGGSGGCLSSNVDPDGLYTVIGSGADAQFGGDTEHQSSSANTARFSFAAFETARTTINVHVEILLTLQTPSGQQRRRMLLEDIASNQIRHSLRSAIVARSEEEAGRFGVDAVIGSAIGGAAIFGVAVFVVMVMAKRRRRRKRESGKSTNSGVSAADHVPDLSPSEVVPPTTDGVVTIECGGAAATEER